MAELPNQTQQKEASEVVAAEALDGKLLQLWKKAIAAYDANNFDYVITIMQAVLEKEPGFLDGRKRLREAAIKKKEGTKRLIPGGSGGLGAMRIQPMVKKDPAQAIINLEKEVLEADPFNPQGNQLLFEACVAAGMPMTAGFALETIVRGNPENTKYMHQLGDYYMERGYPDKATETFAKITALNPQDLEAVQKEKNAAARHSIEQANFDKSFRENLRNQDDAKDLELKNKAAMTEEQRETRIAELQAQYAENNQDLEVVKQLGSLYEDKDDLETAGSFYEWAHHLSGGDVALERKVLEVREEHRNRKIRELSAWLGQNKGHADYDKVQSEYDSFQAQHWATQAEEYKEQVDRNPTDADLRFKYGEALYHAGKFGEAISQLQRAQSSPNLRLKAMVMLGKCYEKSDMNDMAVDQLNTAAAEIPDMTDTKKDLLYSLGLIYEKMGETEKHIACMKQIAQADWDYRDVKERVTGSYG